jgi:hypothetical protein
MCGWLKADLRRLAYATPAEDPAAVHPDNIREVIRLSELYLDGTIRFAIAADARALSLAGMLAGATTALAAGGITLLLTRGFSLVTAALALAAFSGSGILIVGLWNAINAVRPMNFNVAGNYLDRWNSPADLGGSLAVAHLAQATIYQEQINENRRFLLQATGHVERAMRALKLTPFVAIAVGVAAYAAGYLLMLCRL